MFQSQPAAVARRRSGACVIVASGDDGRGQVRMGPAAPSQQRRREGSLRPSRRVGTAGKACRSRNGTAAQNRGPRLPQRGGRWGLRALRRITGSLARSRHVRGPQGHGTDITIPAPTGRSIRPSRSGQWLTGPVTGMALPDRIALFMHRVASGRCGALEWRVHPSATGIPGGFGANLHSRQSDYRCRIPQIRMKNTQKLCVSPSLPVWIRSVCDRHAGRMPFRARGAA